MGSFSLVHWLIFLVVVVVIFGTSKLKNAGKDLGNAVKGFKDAVKEEGAVKQVALQDTDTGETHVVKTEDVIVQKDSQ